MKVLLCSTANHPSATVATTRCSSANVSCAAVPPCGPMFFLRPTVLSKHTHTYKGTSCTAPQLNLHHYAPMLRAQTVERTPPRAYSHTQAEYVCTAGMQQHAKKSHSCVVPAQPNQHGRQRTRAATYCKKCQHTVVVALQANTNSTRPNADWPCRSNPPATTCLDEQ